MPISNARKDPETFLKALTSNCIRLQQAQLTNTHDTSFSELNGYLPEFSLAPSTDPACWQISPLSSCFGCQERAHKSPDKPFKCKAFQVS